MPARRSVVAVTRLDERAATRRLLDRFGFGPGPGELDAAAARGVDATLDAVLAPAGPDPGVAATPPPSLTPAPRSTKAMTQDQAAKKAQQQARRTAQQQVTAWWMDRMTAATHALPERLTWFWHGHFATSAQKVNEPVYLLAQNETLRRLGSGDFGALAQAMAVDPAMLVWLDGRSNRVGAPNENLAREFMELFALGVGHYTETDVREAARALTGWTIDPSSSGAVLVGRRHDAGPKTILGQTATFDTAGLVSMIVDLPASARFVANRLWFRLVSATPPEPAVMEQLVAAYGPRRDVRALLQAIATSAPFRDTATALVKQPVEWAVGLMRATGVRASALPATGATSLASRMTELGQVPFRPPSVGGWPPATSFLTPAGGLTRLAIAETVLAHATIPPGPATPAAQLDWAQAVLGVDAWSARTATALRGVAGGDPRQLLAVAAVTPEYMVST